MTNSQNTKNEQQKDLCITSEQLTEQWKKGELLSGWYYVELIRGEHRIDLYINDKNEWIDCPDEIIDKVLTQIPTYEEYQALLSDQLAKEEGEEIVAELEAENKKHKELLEECRPALVRFVSYDDSEENARILLMNKINELLK